MHRSGSILRRIALACALVPFSAAEPVFAAPGEREGCIRDFNPQTDYFPDKAEIEYATGFSVTYHGYYKVLTTRGAGDGGAQDVLVLVQCGAPAPALTGVLAGAGLAIIPARTLGANEDLTLNRARVLGYADRVIAAGGDGIYSPDLRERVISGKAVKIGESFHGEPNYERLLAAAPDIVFLSTASLARAESLARTRALGVPAAPTMSWAEPSVLGQAEWLYQVAVFLNAEAKANEVLAGAKERYRTLSARANAASERPTIIWLDSAQQRDQWRVPENNWIAELVDDAGARTPWADEDGAPTRIVTTEQILGAGAGARAFVTETAALSQPGTIGAIEMLPAVREGRIFDVHRRARPEHNAYDWYESAIVEVDRVLEDLVALAHPDLLPDHEFRYLQPARRSESQQENQ